MKRVLLILVMTTTMLMSCNEKKKDTTSDKKEENKGGYIPKVELTSEIMSAEVLNSMGRLGGVSLSPDKKTVLYSVTYPHIQENRMYKDWYTVALPDGKPVQITNTSKNEGEVQWRPDGKKLGFIQDGAIWEMNPDGTAKTKRMELSERVEGFKYAPDMKHIFYLQSVSFGESMKEIHPDLQKADAHYTDHMMSRHWDHWVKKYSHIFVTTYNENGNLNAGKDIMEGEQWETPVRPFGGMSDIVWNPNGKEIAYVCRKKKGKEYALSTNTDIYFYNLENNETKNVTDGNMGYDRNHAFSPDGKKMVWSSMERDGFEADQERIFVMNLETGKTTNYGDTFKQMLAHGFAWNTNSDAIYFISDWHAKDDIYKLSLTDKKVEKVTEGVHNYKSVIDAGNNTLIAVRQSMSHPNELYAVNSTDGSARNISNVNTELLGKLKMGEVQEHWVRTTDGKKMLVWMVLPPNFDKNKKYPTLLYCQGGPQGTVSQFWSYRWNFQMMAAKGYIVVAPNRRGLQGFGKEWLEQISKDYGGQNQKDYLSAIDYAAEMPYVNKDRMGAIGASYGGFSVYWLAGHHNKRFKALVAHAGIFNFEAMYLSTEEMWFVNWDMGGNYWDKTNKAAQRSFTFSPHRFVDKWDAPILVIHGERDYRIPYTQGLQAFNAAKLRGIDAEMLIFPEENHWILQPQNSVVWQRTFFNFLDKHLKDNK